MKRLLLLAGAFTILGVPWANATVEIRAYNTAGGGDTGWIVCPDPSCGFNMLAVGNYTVTASLAVKNDGFNPFLDLSYSATNGVVAVPGTIIFEALADGYSVNSPQYQVIASGNGQGGTFKTTAYGGNNNSLCAAGFNACWVPAPNGTASAFLASVGPLANTHYDQTVTGAVGNTANPYSLGLVVSLTPSKKGTSSGDIMLNAVPEPASVTLLGGVLLFGMTMLRRKVRRS